MKELKIDFGCGSDKKSKEHIGIDKFKGKQVDLICDIEKENLPIPNDCVDEIYTESALEHINDIDKVMKEFERVLKVEGRLEIIVPYFRNHLMIQPYHKLNFNWSSFDYFQEKRDDATLQAKESLLLIKKEFIFERMNFFGLVNWVAEKNPNVYERWFGVFFSARYLRFVLIKTKNVKTNE